MFTMTDLKSTFPRRHGKPNYTVIVIGIAFAASLYLCLVIYGREQALIDIVKGIALKMNAVQTPVMRTLEPVQYSLEHPYAAVLNSIQRLCGKLCDYRYQDSDSAAFTPEGSPWRVRKIENVDCKALFQPFFDQPAKGWPPPATVPSELLSEYTLNGQMTVIPFYLENRYAGGDALHSEWTESIVEETMERLRNGSYLGSYDKDGFDSLSRAMNELNVSSKTVLVVGSEYPWLESLALLHGATMVYTLEYGKIVSSHPKLNSFLPDEFAGRFLNGNLPSFDFIFSFSSLEHSGLGRYGDELNPYGDVIAVARLRCASQPHTTLVLGLPGSANDEDRLFWNAHRLYGKLRWPFVTTNWVPLFPKHKFSEGNLFHGVYAFTPIG